MSTKTLKWRSGERSREYQWLVNKFNQNNNFDSLTWTVPNEKGIWEIHVNVSNVDGEDHLEWVISTLSASEAPDFFDYFADRKYTKRTETDCWGRPLNNWTLNRGSIDASKGFLATPEQGELASQNAQTVRYGTWRMWFMFTEGFESTRKAGFSWKLLRLSGGYVKYEMEEDAHHYFEWRGEYDVCYHRDCGFGPIPGKWYKATIIRTPDNFWYTYIEDTLDFRWYDDNSELFDSPTYSQLMKIQNTAGTPNEVYVDGLEIYENEYLFPETSIEYKAYVYNWGHSEVSGDEWEPNYRNGVVIRGRGVTLSQVNSMINHSSLFEYDSTTKTAIVNDLNF
jgi:hypothetical protein